jgi:hypothetical protein
MEVTNVKIEKRVANEKALYPFVKMIKANGVSNPLSLLPQTPWHKVSFTLKKTSSSMANGIRRVLIEELLTKCLWFKDTDLTTDDEFILADVLQMNVGLIPIVQDGKNYAGKVISLYKYNNTNDVIDIKASDIMISSSKVTIKSTDSTLQSSDKSASKEIVPTTDAEDDTVNDVVDDAESPVPHKSKKKKNPKIGGVSNDALKELIPDPNITIMSLRPGKFINIEEMSFLEGFSKDDAGKFSLLDNVSYHILNVDPYDQFTHKGKRSIEYDPTDFQISFKTCANITPKHVMKKLVDTIMIKLNRAKAFVIEYTKSEDPNAYFYTEGFEVKVNDEIKSYRFRGEYITLSNMLAHRCYALDPTILFCAPAVERLDSELAIVRLNHADANKLLITAIDDCITDVKTLADAFN